MYTNTMTNISSTNESENGNPDVTQQNHLIPPPQVTFVQFFIEETNSFNLFNVILCNFVVLNLGMLAL